MKQPNALWTLDNTEFLSWFERDRQFVGIQDMDGKTIFELWDDKVTEFVIDGFKSDRESWHKSLVDYANSHNLEAK